MLHFKTIYDFFDFLYIFQSRKFDIKYYKHLNPDVDRKKVNPIWHYVRHGWHEGRNPCRWFSTYDYLKANPDIEAAGINPFVHYLRFGKKENRTLSPNSWQDWYQARKDNPWNPVSSTLPVGLNLVGFFSTAKGIAEAARSTIKALNTTEINYSIINFESSIPDDLKTLPLPTANFLNKFAYNTNLIHVNPPEMPLVWQNYSKQNLTGRYTIGVWYWELPDFPADWLFAFNLVDEVWVGSRFIEQSLTKHSTVPVRLIPPCIEVDVDETLNRLFFNLPQDRFLYLCAYDVASTSARKNPQGAIDAYLKAFPNPTNQTGLVIKVNASKNSFDQLSTLEEKISHREDIFLINKQLSRTEMNTLIDLTDVYVSLHRAEGFGLIPAEAMYLGKPVIMTNWSGNTDLMTGDNACGVTYQLVPIKDQQGPYPSGGTWAEPDIEHAAFFMKRLMSDKDYYQCISQKASFHIRHNFSPERIGSLIKQRLLDIQ